MSMIGLHQIASRTLSELAAALEHQRLFLDASEVILKRYVPQHHIPLILQAFQHFKALGMHEKAVAYTLSLLVQQQESHKQYRDRIEVVWTVPAIEGNRDRDTSLVVENLFRQARREIWIATYVLDQPRKAFQIFQPLMVNMAANPDLETHILLTIQRPYKSNIHPSNLLRQFSANFCQELWGTSRKPEIFYDARTFDRPNTHEHFCFHSKFIVVDGEIILITSANFTEAAHQRNIETGILLKDLDIAKTIIDQVKLLIKEKIMVRLELP